MKHDLFLQTTCAAVVMSFKAVVSSSSRQLQQDLSYYSTGEDASKLRAIE